MSFVLTSVTKDYVCLGFGGSFVPFGGFFLFALVSVVVIATAPAYPGSFLIAACRFTNLARSSGPGFFPFSLMEYGGSAADFPVFRRRIQDNLEDGLLSDAHAENLISTEVCDR